MKVSWDNKVMASVYLWMDYVLCEKGSGFQNASGNFYPTVELESGLYSYSAPYKPFISDSGITNATFITGVYLNDVLVGKGTSGLIDINYDEGTVYFNTQIPTTVPISGNFAYKEFPVSFATRPEESILFETKYLIKNKITQTLTGLAENEETYPIIYLKNNGGINEPFALGGTDQTINNVRAIILADNQFNLDSVMSLLKDQVKTYIPIVEFSESPYNSLGGLTGTYMYSDVLSSKVPATASFIDNVTVLAFDRTTYLMSEFRKLNSELYAGMVDLRILSARNPRT